jgi:flagellar basal-body rod protein FlgB
MLLTIFDDSIARLERGLAYASRRHEVLAQNVANLETPGFQARDLVFEAQLAGATPVPTDLSPRPGGDLPAGVTLVLSRDGAASPNGNDVSLDRQMARLAENTLFQHALAQILTSQFNALRQAISGRV